SKSVTRMTSRGASSEIPDSRSASPSAARRSITCGTCPPLGGHSCAQPGGGNEIAYVLHLPADPARDVVGPHHVARAVILPAPLLNAHHQALVDGLGGRLDIEGVHREHVRMQLLV